MNDRLPWDITAADADDDNAAAAAAAQVVRRLLVGLLLTAAALDLTRCGLVMTAARHPAPTAGLAATGLTARTARGCQVGQRWAGWAALLIGAASAPQAVASGFRSPYTIPDTATAAVGLLLAITILATAGRMGHRDPTPQFPLCRTGKPRHPSSDGHSEDHSEDLSEATGDRAGVAVGYKAVCSSRGWGRGDGSPQLSSRTAPRVSTSMLNNSEGAGRWHPER